MKGLWAALTVCTALLGPGTVRPQTAEYAYDANGNLVRDGRRGLLFRYNFLNLLSEVTDTCGRLVARYDYDTQGRLLQVLDSLGNGYAYVGSFTYKVGDGKYVLEGVDFGEGRLVASRDGQGKEKYSAQYYVKDHLGSVRAVIDGDGRVIERNDYYPSGKRWDDPRSPQAGNRYGYAGKERQTVGGDRGLYDFGARPYDTETGRFLTVDPLAEKRPGQTPYGFAGGNPIKHVDPTGEDYGLYFDWKTKTVTVRATYYAPYRDLKTAQKAVNYYNGVKGVKAVVRRSGDDKEGTAFDLKFELKAVGVKSPKEAIDFARYDPEGNSFSSFTDPAFEEVVGGKTELNDIPHTNGYAQYGKNILLRRSRENTQTPIHEVGHSLGMGHSSLGIMTPASNDPTRSNALDIRNLQEMIQNPLQGKSTTGKVHGFNNLNTSIGVTLLLNQNRNRP